MNKSIKILTLAVVVIFTNVTFAGSENSLATSSKRVYLNSSQQVTGWASSRGKPDESFDLTNLTSDNVDIIEENPARVSAKVTGCSVSTSDTSVKASASRNDNGCEIALDYSKAQLLSVEVKVYFEKDKSPNNEYHSDTEKAMNMFMMALAILGLLGIWVAVKRHNSKEV